MKTKSTLKNCQMSLGCTAHPLLSRALGIGLAAVLMGACSANDGNVSSGPPISGAGGGDSHGTGGATDPGGVASTGGANVNTGGANANTGGANASTGGVVSTGGYLSTSMATGGKTSTGGAPATGGKAGAVGGAATGGKTGTATGGKSSTATGGMSSTGGVTATGTGGSTSTCSPSATKFSFFVTSQARLSALAQAFNGSTKGFGGDLRYGQTTGLAGADKICTAIAEASMPGNCKTWRAFLSASNGGSGTAVNAISRIGTGPWYDRLGRLFGTSTTTIAATRPDAATAIVNDLPNEDGVLNHDALQSGNTTNQDNHDTLTGSNATGGLYSATSNCTNWTSSAASTSAKPRVGHTWPAQSGQSWISALDESGCAPGVNLVETGPPGNDGTVGSGGGYGGFYCFALSP